MKTNTARCPHCGAVQQAHIGLAHNFEPNDKCLECGKWADEPVDDDWKKLKIAADVLIMETQTSHVGSATTLKFGGNNAALNGESISCSEADSATVRLKTIQPVECREAFEGWYFMRYCIIPERKMQASKNGYEDSMANTRWVCWQAAWNIRAPEWQPIETAPKDGTRILLYKKNKTDAYWCIVEAEWFEGQFYACSKEDIIDWDAGILTATHWMPAPKIPSTTVIEGGQA